MRIASLLLLAAGLLPGAVLETLPQPSFFFYEENVGQASDPEAILLVRGGPPQSYLSARELHLFTPYSSRVGSEIRVRFAAAESSPEMRPLETWPGRAHRFVGPEAQWQRNLAAHRRVELAEVYPGVDLILSGQGARIVMTYVVRPGADPGAVLLESNLTAQLADGAWRVDGFPFLRGSATFATPAGYQGTDDSRVAVDASYEVRGAMQAGLRVGSYDAQQPLYLEIAVDAGGGFALTPSAVDDAGNVYLTGSAPSAVLCGVTTGGTEEACPDAFVAAYDARGEPLFYTVLAGAAEDAAAFAGLDGAGGLSVAGTTASEDFPVTADAFQPANAGPIGPRPLGVAATFGDLFLARLDAVTGEMLYSTFFGGPGGESSRSIAVADGLLTALAHTESADFPTTPGAWIPTAEPRCDGCGVDALVQFDLRAGRPRFSTFLPPVEPGGGAIAARPDGSVYYAGAADQPVPVTGGAAQTELRGASDAYVFRLAPDGSQPVWATYYGGPGSDRASGVALGGDGQVWITGYSDSLGLNLGQEPSSFLARFAADGSEVAASAFPTDLGGTLLPDGSGGILHYMAAATPSLPVTGDALLPSGCGNNDGHGYLRRFTAAGALEQASYLPGPGSSPKQALADPAGVFHRVRNGRLERLLLDEPAPFAIGCVSHAASRWNFERVSTGGIVTLVGTKMGPEEGVSGAPVDGRFPTELGGVRVLMDGIPAPLLYAQAGQINAVTPYAVTGREPIDVVVEYDGRTTEPLQVDVFPYDFALFSLDGSGMGQAAALNQDGTLNTPENPADPGSIIVLYGAGAGATVPPSLDGELAPLTDLPAFQTTIKILHNRQYVEPLYAGPAPGLVNGAVQINLRLPDDMPSGPNRINVVVGGSQYVSPATISVR
ncbi:MAG: hypothetical protein GC160_08570 [Acidobacteria bacterium]|nr:hypothetical protein [Acidobacteriota bacterium]